MAKNLEVIPREMRAGNKQVVVESDTTLVPARSLDALAGTIRHEHDLVVKAGQKMLEHAVVCGDALREAKARMKYGEWGSWLEAECRFSRATATFYIRCAAYVDFLHAAEIDTLTGARQFLREHDLRVDRDERTRRRDSVLAQRALGQKPTEIATALCMPLQTVHKYLSDPRYGTRVPHRGERLAGGVRKRGRKSKTARSQGLAITDDLIEGMAQWLVATFGGTLNDHTRDLAGEGLRAALRYDGPIPGETK